MFSRRAEWNTPQNRLTIARSELAAAGTPILDLTESNPTQAGLAYPLDEISDAFARAAHAPYDPDARGITSAREALAEHLGCGVDDLLITASTSEAYSYLFKLLADPGDSIAIATPAYPLLEHLAALELISLRPFALEYHRRWELDAASVRAAADDHTRAIVVVNPNNPTGSYVSNDEQDSLAAFGLPIISDEVFHGFELEGRASQSFRATEALTFVLGGLSKSAGLPHLKLGWIVLRGPDERKRRAAGALELIADNFLSVSTPVQQALPDLLRIAPRVHDAIAARTRRNLRELRRVASAVPSISVLPVEGGWSAVIRVPRLESDEDLAIRLLRSEGVLVHPGYFFDFEQEGFVVVSLLTKPEVFDEGIARMVRALPT